MSRSHVPLLIDLKGRRIVIFGGGEVAERKARLFLQGDLVVVSREFSDGILRMASDELLEIVEADLLSEDGLVIAERALEGAFIAIPATSDRTLNAALEDIARRKGALVNSVDREGEVVVPSIIKKRSVVLAISTGIPALSRYIRMNLEREVEVYALMADLLSRIRKDLKEIVVPQSRRRDLLWAVLSDSSVWACLENGEISSAHEKAYMRVRENLTPDEQDNLDAGDPQEGLDQ
ncbi:MAG TPA: bifunctional precorrin-2 dehydrogenase/sirohydrochlorin ferrochelatase [Methanothrix sp.]|nr:bifunctional precorrin-2 dehydrogenase/sirohydrochlorin ferrochelatase [Methanothrix sp.]HOK57398.1 bifunctional precorrin-2 dehydrogenase/sirohydrochlorin ferrochelatase [Methanothrix sp.]HOL42747.1 bifunctional precorrin-2 dehydrogenase/sirohydrochlorin ferrochelatase [Methanothrix sp.]HPO87684.1 bifunctional precorrin-2 dehydrogenase/sirohydrochlorin ferrochelatase [Methanothrix sp.]